MSVQSLAEVAALSELAATSALGQEWREAAACRGVLAAGEDPFYPEPVRAGGRVSDDLFDLARSICSGCPVQAECLADALEFEECAPGPCVGFRGGFPPKFREALRSLRRGRLMAEAGFFERFEDEPGLEVVADVLRRAGLSERLE